MLKDIVYIILMGILIYTLYNIYIENERSKLRIFSLENQLKEINENLSYYKKCCEKINSINIGMKPSNEILLFILSNSKIPPENKYLLFFDVGEFIYNNITYEYERDDFWKHPVKTFWDKGGDCEDRAILMCYLLSNYFETYLVFTENHTFCAIAENCSEFTKKVNESLKKYNLALKDPLPCISGRFKIYFVKNNYIKEYSDELSLVSFEKPINNIKFLYVFENRIPSNVTQNLKDFYFPQLLIKAEYIKKDGFYDVKLTLENPSYVGGKFTLVYDDINRTLEIGPLEKKEIDIRLKSNKILIKNQFGEEEEITFS